MRVAGYLSLSLDGSTLRVSHLDFWGKRKDSYIPVEEVNSLGDTAETINDTYMKLIQHDSKDVFYYSLRYGRLKMLSKRCSGKLCDDKLLTAANEVWGKVMFS